MAAYGGGKGDHLRAWACWARGLYGMEQKYADRDDRYEEEDREWADPRLPRPTPSPLPLEQGPSDEKCQGLRGLGIGMEIWPDRKK